jgi:N-acetylglucosaminyldiphosphoundecaprenol N-acetyl-beta-D-mannosaminyltransferase
MPLVWGSRRAGFPWRSRVYGPELLDAMCKLRVQRGRRHYFHGGSPHVADQLVSRLTRRYPELIAAGYRSPPFRPLSPEEDAAHVAAIKRGAPDFVSIGLGMPKQENWMVSHVGRIDATALIGIGAAFDLHAGTNPRAPLWMQRSGLERLFRLITDPVRLAPRNLVIIPLSIVRAAQQLCGWKHYKKDW